MCVSVCADSIPAAVVGITVAVALTVTAAVVLVRKRRELVQRKGYIYIIHVLSVGPVSLSMSST